MVVKRKSKQPLIWTGDLPARFQAEPVNISVEFQMEAVKIIDDAETWWKKYEQSFWKRFGKVITDGVEEISKQVEKWDAAYDAMTAEQRKAVNTKLSEMSKHFGETAKKESQKAAQEAFVETMKGVDNKVLKARLTAQVVATFNIVAPTGAAVKATAAVAGAAGAVAGGAGAVAAGVAAAALLGVAASLLKLREGLGTSFAKFKGDMNTVQAKAPVVQVDATAVAEAVKGYNDAKSTDAGNAAAIKAAMEKVRAAAKKLKTDVDALETFTVAARKSLWEGDTKVEAMEAQLGKAGKKGEAIKTAIEHWQVAKAKFETGLKRAEEAKQNAAVVLGAADGAALGDVGAIIKALEGVKGVATKVTEASDVVEKTKTVAEAVSKFAEAVKELKH